MVIRPYPNTHRVISNTNDQRKYTSIMNFEHFGDSHDFVKRGTLQLLAGCGRWSVHPMFTDDAPVRYAEDYCRFIGVPAVSIQSFPQVNRDRGVWLRPALDCADHLLVDPDTGLSFNESGRVPRYENNPKFLVPDELVRIVNARPDKLALVFDQSFHRENPAYDQIEQIDGKLRWFRQQGIQGLAYHSLATFFLVSLNRQVLADARRILLNQLTVENHPRERLI